MRVWKDGGSGGGKDDARWQRDGLIWMCGSRAIGIFPFLADKNGSSRAINMTQDAELSQS